MMLKTNKQFFLIFILSLSICTYNCGGIKPAATGKISKYVEDFFLGEGKMQYFVKPLDYTNALEEDAQLDATFRRADQKNDSVTVNFSVLLKTNSTINSVVINTNKEELIADSVKTFFTEKEKEKILHRVSIKASYNEYRTIFLDQNHTIKVASNDDSTTIYLSKKSKQHIEKIISILDNLL